MPYPKDTLKDHLKAWQEVQSTAIIEGQKVIALADKAKWEKAAGLAGQMVALLEALLITSKLATTAFKTAQSSKPHLKLVALEVEED